MLAPSDPRRIAFFNKPKHTILNTLGLRAGSFDSVDISNLLNRFLGLPMTSLEHLVGSRMKSGPNAGSKLTEHAGIFRPLRADGSTESLHDATMELIQRFHDEAGVPFQVHPQIFPDKLVQAEIDPKKRRGLVPDGLNPHTGEIFECKTLGIGVSGNTAYYSRTDDEQIRAVDIRAKKVFPEYKNKAAAQDSKYFATPEGATGPTQKIMLNYKKRFVPLVIGEFGELSAELDHLIVTLAKTKAEKAEHRTPRQDVPHLAYPVIIWDFRRRLARLHARHRCDMITRGVKFLDLRELIISDAARSVANLVDEHALSDRLDRQMYDAAARF